MIRISDGVPEAEVQLLPDLLFEAIADPATAAKAGAVHDERIQALRQDGMIQLESQAGVRPEQPEAGQNLGRRGGRLR